MTYRKSASHRSSIPGGGRAWIALPILLIGASVYWKLPDFGAPDYPSKWAAPKLFTGSKGGCPDLTGIYDGVNEEVPRLLQGSPAWVRGIRPWFEHKAAVTQAEDGSWLEIQFALNERGLPEHRAHVMTYNEGWPHGGKLVLKRDKDYRCSGRWLRSLNNDAVVVSRNRDGDLIVGETRQVSGEFRYGTISFGPESVDKTIWRRWSVRPAAADAQMQAVYSFEVNRFPWLNKDGTEVVVKVGNYLGEDICLRVWEANALHAEDKSANADLVTGSIYDSAGCPPAWLRMRALGNDNFGLRVPDVPYRIAWRPTADPDAAPRIMEVPYPTDLPAMPDQDDARRKRAKGGVQPEAPVLDRAIERQRELDQARALGELRRQQRAAEAAVPRFASKSTIRHRVQWLQLQGVDIKEAIIADQRVRILGDADSNAAVSKLMRAIEEADEKAEPKLISTRQLDGRMQFEIMLQPCPLTEL
jgi:hypothetical protein